MSNKDLTIPPYFHREYKNDFPKQEPQKEESPSQVLRVAKVALPFVALYQPFGRTLACGLGVARTITTFGECHSAENFQKLSWSILQTCLALASVAGTIFLHPMGMLITTLSDVGGNVHCVYQAMAHGEMLDAAKQTMRVANNSLYLALILSGSVQLQLASLALQVLIEGSSSYEEFSKDNILETIGHLGMCMVRMNQSHQQLGILQEKWNCESLSQKSEMKVTTPKPVAPSDDQEGELSDFAISGTHQGKWHPALGALKEQHSEHLQFAEFSEECDSPFPAAIKEAYPEVKAYGDKGNLVAIWLDAKTSGLKLPNENVRGFWNQQEKIFKASQFDAATNNWSEPIEFFPESFSENWSFLNVDLKGNASILFSTIDRTIQSTTFQASTGKWTGLMNLGQFTGECRFNHIAFDSNAFGNCTVVWYPERREGDYSLFATATYDAKTQSWSAPTSIITKNSQFYPQRNASPLVSRDDSGNVCVLCELLSVPNEHWSIDTESHLIATIFDSASNKWLDPECIHDFPESFVPQIVGLISNGQGKFFGILQTVEELEEDEIVGSLRSIIYDCQKKKWDQPKEIDVNPQGYSRIYLEKDSSGNPIVAWEAETTDCDSNDDDDLGYEELMLDYISSGKKISSAQFDLKSNQWKTSDIVTGILGKPKFVHAKGQLYMVWKEYCLPESPDNPPTLKVQRISIDGNKEQWPTPKTLVEFPLENEDFLNASDTGANYTISINDGYINVIWKEDDKYHHFGTLMEKD